MPRYNAYVPDGVEDAGRVGLRPSVQHILDLIDASNRAGARKRISGTSSSGSCACGANTSGTHPNSESTSSRCAPYWRTPDPSWTTLRSADHWGARKLPPPKSTRTVTAMEAITEIGVTSGTFWAWVRRGILLPIGQDDQGRKIFYREHVELMWNTRRKRSARSLTTE